VGESTKRKTDKKEKAKIQQIKQNWTTIKSK